MSYDPVAGGLLIASFVAVVVGIWIDRRSGRFRR